MGTDGLPGQLICDSFALVDSVYRVGLALQNYMATTAGPLAVVSFAGEAW